MNSSFIKLFLSFGLISSTISSVLARQRIIGGKDAGRGAYPWFTLLFYMDYDGQEKMYGCGGMLVSPEWVLTANHCVSDVFRYSGTVRVGAYRAPFEEGNNGNQDVESFTVKEVVEHPNYYTFFSGAVGTFIPGNDFALLRLDGKSSVTPVPLDSSGLSETYSTGKDDLWVMGLGNTAQDSIIPPKTLRHAELRYITNSDCTSKYAYDASEIHTNMLCAANPGQDTCQGDSGGPLYDKGNDALLVSQVGDSDATIHIILGWVSDSYDWIKETICGNSNDPPSWCYLKECADTPYVFKLKDSKNKHRKCGWAKRHTANRCNIEGVSEACPKTCGTCSICADTSLKFVVEKANGSTANRSCNWADMSKCQRYSDSLPDTCRATCGSCQSGR